MDMKTSETQTKKKKRTEVIIDDGHIRDVAEFQEPKELYQDFLKKI